MMISTYSKFCSLCAINRIINVHKERRETERNLGGRSKKMSITIRNCKKSVDCLCDNFSNLQIPPTNMGTDDNFPFKGTFHKLCDTTFVFFLLL